MITLSSPQSFSPTDFLDPAYFEQLLDQYRISYQTADPFPHVVIDNFLPVDLLDKILTEFPGENAIDWQKFAAASESKLASKSELQMGYNTRLLLYQLNSSFFLNFLQELTGIKEAIIPDPHFEGGGLHQITPGGYLKVHVDFNRHSRLNLDRRINLLIYLNKDWQEEYGGNLELWDKDVSTCHKKILPIFNRCVIFNTNDFSYHGHPDPLTCPQDRTRKSLALYYYSNGRPASDLSGKAHSTVFRARPGEDIPQENIQKKSLKGFLKNLLVGKQ